MSATDQELLRQFTREQSQDAFTELVKRHLSLVHSAALRQVRLPQVAEEISQTVFTQLASQAARLRPDTVLTAWLYQVTRHAAVDAIRREARRQAREQIAVQMSDLHSPDPAWSRIEPLLDEAMESLDVEDRTAVLLRFFENKSLREVGEALGASEDAAQKRVSRALERLRGYLSKRQVTVSATSLAILVSTNAVQAAPAGLAVAVAGGVLLSTTALSSASTALTVTNTLAMTTLQKTLVTVTLVVAAGFGVYEARKTAVLRGEMLALQEQQRQSLSAMSNQVQQLRRERDEATNALASLAQQSPARNTNEVLKLRGEVGRLRSEKAQIGSTSGLSKVTSNPEARTMLRNQQKLGMSILYKDLAQRLKLETQQTEQLNDLLADHIMDNVDLVTTALRDKLTVAQVDEMLAAGEARLQQQVEEQFGAEGLTQYKDHTANLLSTISSEQFKSMLTGSDEAKQEKARQFREVLQEGVRSNLAAAGLPADYQTVPILNFRNIVFEQEGERSVQLLDSIYQYAADHSGGFLAPEDLAKFQEFRTLAGSNSRSALALNRAMMAPIAD